MEVSREQQAFAAAGLVEGLQADAPIGFAVHDERLRYELLSPSMAALNGAPVEDHLGRRVTEILPGALAGDIEALLADVRDTGVARTGVELDGTTDAKPGEVRTWVATYYPMDLDGRRLVGAVLVDVTDRRRAQQALKRSDELLSGAQRMAGLGWWKWTVEPETVVYAPELVAMMGGDPALGGTPRALGRLEIIDAEELARVRGEALAAIARRRPFSCQLRARRTDGELRILHARADLVLGEDGEPAGLQGFVQDVTDLERAARRQRIVAELGQGALAGASLDELMRRATNGVAAGIDVDAAAVLELLPGGDELAVRAAHVPAGYAGPGVVALTRNGVTERALTTGQPAIVDDWQHEQVLVRDDAEAAMGARSSAAVVIGGRGRAFGLLGVLSTKPGRFGPDDATFLQLVANTLADAVERRLAEAEITEISAARGRLVAQALDAEDRARRRISESLHDGALQDVLAIGHDLYALRGHGDDEALSEAQESLAAVVRQLRDVMSALHPTVLQHGGLEAALGAVADQHAHAAGFETRLDVDADAVGHRDELLLSVARELLANAARHARARNVELGLHRAGDRVALEVADDGIGLTPGRLAQARAEGRIGLASCSERMEAVGGSLTVTSSVGAGTRVLAEAPSDSPKN